MGIRSTLCAALLITVSARAETLPASIPAPAVHIGDRWTIQHTDKWSGKLGNKTTQEVVGMAHDEILLESKNANTGQLAFRLKFTSEMNPISRGTMRYSPFFPRYAFPLEPGKTWRQDFTAANSSNGRSWRYEVTGRVVGWEKVSVPAGRFDALRVELEAFYQGTGHFGSGSGRQVETLWYAPAVNNFVKHDYQDTDWKGSIFDRSSWELEAFKVKQPSLDHMSGD